MKKHLVLCLLFCIAYQSYSQSNNWIISSEISPMSRSGNEWVPNNPTATNLEWRNRVGFKLGEQTMLGLSSSYRKYDLEEIADYITMRIGAGMTTGTITNCSVWGLS